MLFRDESEIISEFRGFTILLPKVKLQESSKHYQPASRWHDILRTLNIAFRESDISA